MHCLIRLSWRLDWHSLQVSKAPRPPVVFYPPVFCLVDSHCPAISRVPPPSLPLKQISSWASNPYTVAWYSQTGNKLGYCRIHLFCLPSQGYSVLKIVISYVLPSFQTGHGHCLGVLWKIQIPGICHWPIWGHLWNSGQIYTRWLTLFSF